MPRHGHPLLRRRDGEECARKPGSEKDDLVPREVCSFPNDKDSAQDKRDNNRDDEVRLHGITQSAAAGQLIAMA
jgi:hypothetical protein